MRYFGLNIGDMCLMLGITLLIIVYRRWRTWQKERLHRPGLRLFEEMQSSNKREFEDGVWFCPQCYTIRGSKGACPSKEHGFPPVQMQLGSYENLEYYNKMRALLGTATDD